MAEFEKRPPKETLNEGIVMCRSNAYSLLNDAKRLMRARSYGHALSLAVMAFEEFGKMIILIAAKQGATEFDKQLSKMAFRDHLSKLAMVLQILAISQEYELSKSVSDYINQTVPKLQSAKERGIYVDYFSQNWHSPLEQEMEGAAKKFIPETEQFMEQVDKWLDF